MNFWDKLKKPIMILAPLDGVTDTVFRQIVCSVGKLASSSTSRSGPDVMFTEFVPVNAILSQAQEKVIEKSLGFSEIERPIVAQIWGTDPEKFYQAAQIISKLGFDGIDINMGCPGKGKACSALIRTPKLAQEIILATIKGSDGLPVSVKTRIGFSQIDTENWVRTLLQTPITALTLHLRTAHEMSKVPAHWEEIRKAVDIRQQVNSKALIIGNGDVKTLQEAKDKCNKYGIDGVMIGRGIFENVWLFNPKIDPDKITPLDKLNLLLKHLKLFKKTFGSSRHFELMKKFVKCYVNNFNGASEARESLMTTKNLEQLIEFTKKVKENLTSF